MVNTMIVWNTTAP